MTYEEVKNLVNLEAETLLKDYKVKLGNYHNGAYHGVETLQIRLLGIISKLEVKGSKK
jgi:hypothetical protein